MNRQKLIGGIPLLISVIALAISVTIFFLGRNKIAYVNTAELMSQLTIAKKLQQDIEQMNINSKMKTDTLNMEFQNALKKYEKELVKMTRKEVQLSKELLQIKQRQVAEYEQTVKRKNMLEERQMTQSILEKVNSYIADYGKKNGYDIVFATNGGNIVYAGSYLDITHKIIEGINDRK